jgi:ribosomal protein S18 acetylase RimI-like enzyme
MIEHYENNLRAIKLYAIFSAQKHYTMKINKKNVMEHKSYRLNDGREIHIRPLQDTDSDQINSFYRSLSPKSLKWVNAPKPYQIYEIFRYPDYYISLVTIHDGIVVGYGEIIKDSMKRDGELTIHIHQDYQGVGLGTAMMIMLIKEATEHQLQCINLQVAADNTKAVRLFMKFGFQWHQTTQELYGEKELDTLHMKKVLNI